MEKITATIKETPAFNASLENIRVINMDTVASHALMRDRELADQHPISAITGLEDALKNGVSEEKVTMAVESALASAKASGAFDGKDGYTPIKGVDYYTESDREEIETYVTSELAKRGQLAPEFAESVEWLRENGDRSKMYVLPDGMIWAYMLTEIEAGPSYTNRIPLAINADGTPYIGNNGEKGYKTGWRINSSLVEKEAEGRCCTGFIPVKSTDVVRWKNIRPPVDNNTNGYVYFYKNDFATRVGTMYDVTFVNTNEFQFTPNNVNSLNSSNANASDETAYMRISTGIITDESIITINEEIVDGEIVRGYDWASTAHAFVPADYEERIVDLENEVSQNSADIEELKSGNFASTPIKDWDAPVYDANIPVFELSAEKEAMTNAPCTPSDIYAKYDALMAKHPHYIVKTDLGLCSDGVNHVYRYDFREPDCRHTGGYDWSETKAKAVLVSGIHYEWAGTYGLYYALEEIADNPALRDFRRNTHLIVVPCANPYATIADNYTQSRGVKNANGVEIHRNFEVDWISTEAGSLHHGGAAPLSEVETQYIDNIMKENTDAAFFLSCHSFADTSFNFIWPSVATKYMCNMGCRLIDKMSDAWHSRYDLVGLEDYRTEDIPSWDDRLGFAHVSMTDGTETKQATKYGIQGANVEINGRFWVHGTKADPEPAMSAFTMSRGAEVYVNFLLTAFGVYDPKDKKCYVRNVLS